MKNLKSQRIIFIILILFPIITFKISDEKVTVRNILKVDFPEIIYDDKNAETYFSPKLMASPIYLIYTIDSFSTTINLNKKFDLYKFQTKNKFYDTMPNRRGFKIYIDTSKEIPMINNSYEVWNSSDKTKNHSQKIISYPVYIINTSSNEVKLNVQDGELMMIQEALDKKGEWQPIEYHLFASCSENYFDIDVPSQYCVMTKVAKYKGNFKTLLRIKLLNQDQVYFSCAFKGSINFSQLNTRHLKPYLEPKIFLNME